jgi:hypothetical protein
MERPLWVSRRQFSLKPADGRYWAVSRHSVRRFCGGLDRISIAQDRTSAPTESGHSDWLKCPDFSGCFRPEAAVEFVRLAVVFSVQSQLN